MVSSNAALNPEEKKDNFNSLKNIGSDFDELLKKIAKKYAIGSTSDSSIAEEKINWMLDFYMPSSIKTRDHMFQWVEENWDRYQLISF